MKIKILERTHELDLEDAVNEFIININLISLHYQVAMTYGDEIEYSFSCLIVYNEPKE